MTNNPGESCDSGSGGGGQPRLAARRRPDGVSLEPDPARVVVGLCPGCGYDLVGLAGRGRCPECGRAYSAQRLLLLRRLPGALEVFLRFGWPVIVLAVSLAHPVFSSDPWAGVHWLFVAALILAVTALNAVTQAMWLARSCVITGARSRPFSERLSMLGGVAVVLFNVTLIVPAVIVGGCLVIMCAGTM